MSRREALRNFGYLGAGKVLGDLATFLLFVVLARHFGPEGVGLYAVAMGVSGVMAAAADFGLCNYVLTEASRPAPRADLLGQVLSLQLVLSAVVLLPYLGAILVADLAPEVAWLWVLLGLYQLLLRIAQGFAFGLLARGHPAIGPGIEILSRVAAVGAGIAIAEGGGGLTWALAPLTLAALVQAALLLELARRKVGGVRLVLHRRSLWTTAHGARAYAVLGVVALVATRVDVLMLGWLLGTGAAGIYHAAARMTGLAVHVSQLAAYGWRPLASRTYASAPEKVAALYHQALGDVALWTIPAGAGLAWIAPDLVMLVFGQGFEQTGVVLRLLAPLVVLAFFTQVTGAFLLACDRAGARARHQVKALLLQIATSVVLIPALGVPGAALSSLASQAVLLVLLARELATLTGRLQVAPRLWIAMTGTAAFSGALAILPPLSLGATIAVGCGLYGATLVAFREIRETEVRLVLRWLGRWR